MEQDFESFEQKPEDDEALDFTKLNADVSEDEMAQARKELDEVNEREELVTSYDLACRVITELNSGSLSRDTPNPTRLALILTETFEDLLSGRLKLIEDEKRGRSTDDGE